MAPPEGLADAPALFFFEKDCRMPAPVSAFARVRKPAQPKPGQRILAALLMGSSLEKIAEQEAISLKRVEKLLRDELHKRWVAPAQDYARIQVARLETILAELTAKAEKGEIAAIDRILKVLDRLDRYHGFGKLMPVAREDPDEIHKRLMERLDRAAGRLLPPPPEGQP